MICTFKRYSVFYPRTLCPIDFLLTGLSLHSMLYIS